jgi:hypothetical protein
LIVWGVLKIPNNKSQIPNKLQSQKLKSQADSVRYQPVPARMPVEPRRGEIIVENGYKDKSASPYRGDQIVKAGILRRGEVPLKQLFRPAGAPNS